MAPSGLTCLICGNPLPADAIADLCPRCQDGRCQDGDQAAVADWTPQSAAWVQRVRRAGAFLYGAGLAYLVGCVAAPAFLAMIDVFRFGEPANHQWLEAYIGVQLLVGLVLGTMIVWGAQAARLIQEPARVRRAAWLAMLPVSPAVVIGLPAGLWMLYLMRQPEVLEEFLKAEKKALAERIYEAELVRHRPLSDSPWYALGWIVGHAPWTRVLMLLCSLLAALFVLGSWRTVETVMNQDRMRGMFRWSVDEAGSHFVHGKLIALVGLVNAMIVLNTFRRRASPWRGYIALHAGLIMTFAAIMFITIPPAAPMDSVLRARYGVYGTMWLGVALTLLAVRDLRRSIRLAAPLDRRPPVGKDSTAR